MSRIKRRWYMHVAQKHILAPKCPKKCLRKKFLGTSRIFCYFLFVTRAWHIFLLFLILFYLNCRFAWSCVGFTKFLPISWNEGVWRYIVFYQDFLQSFIFLFGRWKSLLTELVKAAFWFLVFGRFCLRMFDFFLACMITVTTLGECLELLPLSFW